MTNAYHALIRLIIARNAHLEKHAPSVMKILPRSKEENVLNVFHNGQKLQRENVNAKMVNL